MKRIFALFSLMLVLSVLSGCAGHNNGPDCKLIVNGKDITDGHHVSIDKKKELAQIPILAILEELGVTIEETTTYSADTSFRIHSIYTEYNGFHFTFLSNEKDYGLRSPEWVSQPVRKWKDGEFIVDHVSVSAMLHYIWQADISVDFENNVVSVDSIELPVDEELPKQTNCKLVVDGNDITEGIYAHIDHESQNAVIPVIAVQKALGAQIEWYPRWESSGIQTCMVYCTTETGFITFDTSISSFGWTTGDMMTPDYVRKTIGNELYMDCESLRSLWFHGSDINIRIDYENNIIYIDPLHYVIPRQ